VKMQGGVVVFCSAADATQGLAHARQGLYHLVHLF
jgi:hypothetical protein